MFVYFYLCYLSLFYFFFFFFLMIRRPPRSTRSDNSFPTRRSSDLRSPGRWSWPRWCSRPGARRSTAWTTPSSSPPRAARRCTRASSSVHWRGKSSSSRWRRSTASISSRPPCSACGARWRACCRRSKPGPASPASTATTCRGRCPAPLKRGSAATHATVRSWPPRSSPRSPATASCASCTRPGRSTASTCTRAIRRPRTWRPCARTARARSTAAASRRCARRWLAPKRRRRLFDDDVRVENVAVGFHGVLVVDVRGFAIVLCDDLDFARRPRLRHDFQRRRPPNHAVAGVRRRPHHHRTGIAVEPEREWRVVGLRAAPGDGVAGLDCARIRGDHRHPVRVVHLDVLRARATGGQQDRQGQAEEQGGQQRNLAHGDLRAIRRRGAGCSRTSAYVLRPPWRTATRPPVRAGWARRGCDRGRCPPSEPLPAAGVPVCCHSARPGPAPPNPDQNSARSGKR